MIVTAFGVWRIETMRKRAMFRIHYDQRSGLVGLLALALLIVAFLGYLAWGRKEVVASGLPAPLASSAGLRGYYLTPGTYNGADADGTDGNGAGICAEGYHFASLWEILDPSNLKYDTKLGRTQDDSGQGPPTLSYGWVRTGYGWSTSSTPGKGNCNAWTSISSGYYGTTAYLTSDWTAGQDIHVWEVYAPRCNVYRYVWCVADNVSIPVYMPIVLKNH
jgi:hypothetical protein